MKWFVMLRGHNRGVPMPLMTVGDDEEPLEIRLFDTEVEADEAGEKTPLGAHYGFEVYEWEP